jgi:hypothetical protein
VEEDTVGIHAIIGNSAVSDPSSSLVLLERDTNY